MNKRVVLGVGAAAVAAMVLLGARESAREDAERQSEARQAAVQRDAYAAKQLALAAQYNSNRDAILASMRSALRSGRAKDAAASGEPYLPFADGEFKRVFDAAKTAAAEEAAKRAAADAAAARKQAVALARATAAKQRREGVAVGMTKTQVLASSWGKPQHINETITAAGTREQWVYAGGAGYLYFDGDRLTGIQTGH